MKRGFLAGALAVIAWAAPTPLLAEPPKPGALVRTIEFDPHAKAAKLATRELDKLGLKGWRALRKLILTFDATQPAAAASMAQVIASGLETERREIVAALYRRCHNDDVRGALALGLAQAYPEHADVVHEHLLKGGAQSVAIFTTLASRDLTEAAAITLMASPLVGYHAYHYVRSLDVLPDIEQLVPLARQLAPQGLYPSLCRKFAKTFAANTDRKLLHALAVVLKDDDVDRRRGAHYLLLTVTGKRLRPSPDIWRSWIDGRSSFQVPEPGSEGEIEAAVLRGAHVLTADLLDDGKALWRRGSSEVGATALVVVSLRAAGVPASHPAIEKAVQSTLAMFGGGGRPGVPAIKEKREVYDLSLLAMALEAIDAKRFTGPLLSIRDRLVQGQASNGQWTYAATRGTGNRPPPSGDNSNTQYALLALRSIRRAGIPVPRETWEKAATYWRGGTHERGGWHYMPARKYHWKRKLSMTSAGIGSLAICMEGLHDDEAAALIEKDAVIARALAYMGELILRNNGLGREELYALYGVERAGMLTSTADFKSKFRHIDWYRSGAEILLGEQRQDGTWGNPRARSDVQGSGYGLVVDTAYAILFLQKATTTIGKGRTRTVAVEIKDEKEPPRPKVEPAPVPVQPPPTPQPSTRALIVEDKVVYTALDTATIRGKVARPGLSIRVDGADTPLDGGGRFEASVPVARSREVRVAAYEKGKEIQYDTVQVVLDIHPPKLELIGGPLRHVGKQRIRFRASEPLAGLTSRNLFVPADSNIVDLPVDLAPGKPNVIVTAVDRAGNEARSRFTFDVQNRVLVLDGKSAVRIDLKEKPAVFTVECWFRADEDPKGGQSLVANTEGSGFALFWRASRSVEPSGYVHTTSDGYLVCNLPRRPRLKRWHHLALSYDGKVARLFLNGKLVTSLEGGPHTPSRHALYVGGEPNSRSEPYEFFHGAIDEVRLSNVARYTKDFKPAKFHGRDIHTLLLLHFDTDSPTAFFDDSRLEHAGRPAGSPRVEVHKR